MFYYTILKLFRVDQRRMDCYNSRKTVSIASSGLNEAS